MPRWAVYLCTCGGKFPVDPEPIRQQAGLVHLGDDPQTAAGAFARAVREAGAERVLIGCCGGLEPFERAFQDAGIAPELEHLDLRGRCFAPHPDTTQANAKAARNKRPGALAAHALGAGGLRPGLMSRLRGNRVRVGTRYFSDGQPNGA